MNRDEIQLFDLNKALFKKICLIDAIKALQLSLKILKKGKDVTNNEKK